MSESYQDLKIKFDPSNMYGEIVGFPEQIKKSIDLMKSWKPKKKYKKLQNILIVGMGGSAISGDIVRVLVNDTIKIPIIVQRSYNIPGWVSDSTLVIASSYSGDTEETISTYLQAVNVGAQVIVMTCGGKLGELAQKNNLDIVPFPGGLQPRSALGYSLSMLLFVLNKIGYINKKILTQLSKSVKILSEFTSNFSISDPQNDAAEIAGNIHKTLPVIYGSEDFTSVIALRLRTQLAENAGMLSYHYNVPEQSHNEIEGWTSNLKITKQTSLIWIKDDEDHPRINNRMEIAGKILNGKCSTQFIIWEEGETKIIRMLKLIHLMDWVSYYAGLLNQVDPSAVPKIILFKEKMQEYDENNDPTNGNVR